jgi:hypothetical protein
MEKTRHPSRRTFLQTALGALAAERAVPAWDAAADGPARPEARETRLFALPQFLRPDPMGGIVRADRDAAAAAKGFQKGQRLSLECPRGACASFHPVVQTARPGMISVLGPVYDSLGEVAGLVEVVSHSS